MQVEKQSFDESHWQLTRTSLLIEVETRVTGYLAGVEDSIAITVGGGVRAELATVQDTDEVAVQSRIIGDIRRRGSVQESFSYHGNQVTVQAFEKLNPRPEHVLVISRYQNW